MREFSDEFFVCPYCGYVVGTEATSRNYLAPGTILRNRYTLGKVLGQGGFGITYIAWDNKIGRAVAIKEYMPSAFASRLNGESEVSCYNQEAKQQFRQGLEKTRNETVTLSRFGSLESVVKVYDCVEANGTAYIIMELLRGRTVKEILAEREKLTFAETLHIMRPILQTLDAMHRVGMIHRDVAPDNIFVCEDGRIKLLDFGAARVVTGADNKTLSVMLKAGYAPVEQYSSKSKQGTYTDVYAASATMYKMLTGETPSDSLSRAKDGSDLKALSHTDAPKGAQQAILRGMAQNSADRIPRAIDLLTALENAADEDAVPVPNAKHSVFESEKRVRTLAVGIAAGILAVAVAFFIVVHFRGKTKDKDVNDTTETTVSAVADETQAVTNQMTGGNTRQKAPEAKSADTTTAARALQTTAALKRIPRVGFIDASIFNTVGLRANGTVIAAGYDGYNQCDVKDWINIIAVAAGDNHIVGLHKNGTVTASGNNEEGQCKVDRWKNIIAIAAADDYTAGLRKDGTVVTAGDSSGHDHLKKVKKWKDIRAIAAGDNHMVGLRKDRTVIAVGSNEFGQCNVSEWTDIVAVAAGNSVTLGLRSDGTVVAAGPNSYGECNVSDWKDIVAIAVGFNHTVGLRSDGTVVATGWNEYGQCNVKDWTNIVAVAAGTHHTVGIRADGTVVATEYIGAPNWDEGQCDVGDWKNMNIPK